jgi:plastocyanin
MKTATALLAIGMLTLAACGSGSKSTTSAVSSSGSPSTSSSGGAYGYGGGKSATTRASSAGAATTIAITMRDYSFGPKVITGKPGSTVKVKLTNSSANEHNFKIDGQKGADADVAPGKTGFATVVIPKSGSVQFYCEYHRGLGMTGTVKAA